MQGKVVDTIRTLPEATHLERVVAVPLDALVDGEEVEVEAIVVLLVEVRQDVSKDSRVWCQLTVKATAAHARACS